MKQLLRSKRAVSPVLATVLMILIVVSGMSLLFAFFVNYTRDYQTGSGSAVLESIMVEDVWFGHPSSNQAEVWVYNFGKVDLTIAKVYVNGNLVNFAGSGSVPVGGHGKLTLRASYDFQFNYVYTFKIVTSRGTALEGRYVWQ